MKKMGVLAMGVGLALGVVVEQAAAQDVPDMVGTWKGMLQAVIIGANPYRVPERPGPYFADKEIEFTYRIDEQQGNRFIGQISVGDIRETLIGAVSMDNHTGIFIDDDGRYEFTLADPQTMNVCYAHSFPTTKAVTCFQLKRAAP
ncbi:MAG TPA: hypothetical protein VHL31_19030 [Geminicoccus sp.]|uniref:hypothetical protein n=1 Tax=Geminicoccus sp. TaxID=2024832 RepID=UPI002E309AC1|nr:hypothetical protein [Geminicoccus sp.]HEX2528382.1 hypothetical protein [Geminicoccus sp.]